MLKKPDLVMDYTNTAIVFGYIGMFSSVSPYAPFLAFLGFYFKLLADVDVMSTI